MELKCELVASPPPSILWFHNNKSIPKTHRRRICSDSQMHRHTTSLVIKGVKDKDTGSYKVMAINNEGSAESTASLLVSMQQEQSANYLSRAKRSTKAHGSKATNADHRQERKFRVDLRCVGSPFDKVSKASLGRSRSETSLVRSVYFRSGSHSKERASTEKSKGLETASERALSPPPMFDRSERFNDRFSDIYCDRRTGARFSDRFSDRLSDTESLHNEVRTKLTTLQKAVKQRKRLSISTMSSSEFELESVASELSYADYVDRLRVRPASLHDVPHFNRPFDLGESQQEIQSKNVGSVSSQSSVRHSFEPQSRTRAIQIMRGELVDTLVEKNGQSFLESHKDDELKEEVSKCHGAVAEQMMEDAFFMVKIPHPEVSDYETSLYPQTTIYPDSGESIPVAIIQEEQSLPESPRLNQVKTLVYDPTESATPEDKIDSITTNQFKEEYEGESLRSPCKKGHETDLLECVQIRKWQQFSKEDISHEIDLPNPTKRLVENKESVGTEALPKTKTKFGDPEALPTAKSTNGKYSLLKEEARMQGRVEEIEAEAPFRSKKNSPRVDVKAADLKEELVPKEKDSPRPSQHRSIKERFLNEPEIPTNIPSDTPYQESYGGESLREEYGKSLEAERIQCEEKLLALRIRKWQQGMQMSEDEPQYHESALMSTETSHMDFEGPMYTQQELREKRSSVENTELKSQTHLRAKSSPRAKPKAEKMIVKTDQEYGFHLSRENISDHESEKFFSEGEALTDRIIKWQQDVLNEQEQASNLQTNKTGDYSKGHAETINEIGEKVPQGSSDIVQQLDMPDNRKSFSAKSAKEKFFMSECSEDFQDQLRDVSQWVTAGRLQTEGRETTLKRDRGDKALAEDILNRQQGVAEKEHIVKIDTEGQQHGICSEPKGHSLSFNKKDTVGIAHEHYSAPLLSSSPHAKEALPLKSSIIQNATKSIPLAPSESESMKMENRQKRDKDTVFVDKARSQCSTDEVDKKEIRDVIPANTENQQKTSEGVSGTKDSVDSVIQCGKITVERCTYGPGNEEMFVQECTELVEGVHQTQKTMRIKDDTGPGGSPPVFVKEISSLKAKVGEMSEFTCQFHGDPLPEVTWLKDGHPLTHNPDFDIVDRANKSRLTVFYPTTDHEGTYDCVITNKYGKSLCSGTLEIADKRAARTPHGSKDAVTATELHQTGEKLESDFEKEISGFMDSGKATLQVPQTVMPGQLCSDDSFSASPVEIRITTATPVPGAREENYDNKPQDCTEEMSPMAAAEGSSNTARHKFTFSHDLAEESPSAVTELMNTIYSEGTIGDVKNPEIFHHQYQDVTHKEEKTECTQPEEATRTKKSKYAVSKEHPGLSGCGLLGSSAVIKVSEIKQAFESDSSLPLMASSHTDERKEIYFSEQCIPAVTAFIDLKDQQGETDPRSVNNDSTFRLSSGSAKTLPDEAEAAVTQTPRASGKLASTQSISPQFAGTATLTLSEVSNSMEKNGGQVCPESAKGSTSTESHGESEQVLEVVQESPELVRPAHSPKQEADEMEVELPVPTFDRTSSFIPFLSEKEKQSVRTSAQSQATVKPKRTPRSSIPESQNLAVMSAARDSELGVVREVIPTCAEEVSVMEELTEVKKCVKGKMEVATGGNIVTGVLGHTEEASLTCEELIKNETTDDSGVFLSEVETQPDFTKTAEETPTHEGEPDVLNNGAQDMVGIHVTSEPQTLMVNPTIDNIPEHHLLMDGSSDSKVMSTQEKSFSKSSGTGVNIATVGSLEEEEVTFGAVYDYYNLPAEWARPMSPESEMSIEFGSTVSEEIAEVAERFFTPGSSTEVSQPLVESFHTPTSPEAFHTPTSVTPGGFVTPQEHPFNLAECKSPSSRESSERFFSPFESLSSPVEWSMETTTVNKKSFFNQGSESSSLGIHEEKVQSVPPAFLKPLMKKRVCENDSLTFFAEVFGLPSPVVRWFFNKTQLVEDDRIKMERDGDSISLTVLDVTKADQGEYICEAVNNIGEARSVALVVVVSQELRFMPAPPAVTHQHVMEFDVEEDDTSRSPSPQEILLEVELDENEVKEFEKQVKIITIPEYTADNKSMIVSLDVLPSIYEEGALDFVTHEHDDLKIAFEVTEMPPRFINPICDMEAPEGTMVTFECSLMGTPSPIVSWFKGDKKIPHNSKKYLHSSDGDNHFLKICAITAQDSGVYICRAINVVGETLCRASLAVVNAKALLGKTRGREVTAVSLRSAKIQPQKFDLMVGGSSFGGEQVSEIELEFEFDQEADESQRAVRLVANTDQQSETSDQGEKYVSINFDVFAEPAKEEKVEFKGKSSDMCSFQFQVTESPPKCIIPLTNITAAVGTPVILQCLVSGIPNPTADWYKDGNQVTDSRCIIQEKNTGHFNLLITNVTQNDAGEYKCIIHNAAGFTETAALLKVF